mgnify:CR=1 FL=1
MLSDERKRFLLIVCVCTALFLGFKFIGPKGTITHWIKAKAEIRRQEKQMEEYRREMAGIYTTCVNENTLDESPMAYKSMEEILRHIGDTAEVISRIKPIYNFKASD